MNRYLEKVAELEKEALNALKARAMAHEAGVVVDPNLQWKWALRQFRGQRGELIQGKERSQVLNRLMGNPAAGNNNFRQAIVKEQRKVRPVDEVQLQRIDDPEYNLVSGDSVFRNTNNRETAGQRKDLSDIVISNSRLNTRFDTHVHPGGQDILRRLSIKNRSKLRMENEVDPFYHKESKNSVGVPSLSILPSGNIWKSPSGKLEVPTQADLLAFSNRKNYNRPSNIISGDGRFLGSHRVPRLGESDDYIKRVRMTSIGLTPRKARPSNPYLDKLHEMGKTL